MKYEILSAVATTSTCAFALAYGVIRKAAQLLAIVGLMVLTPIGEAWLMQEPKGFWNHYAGAMSIHLYQSLSEVVPYPSVIALVLLPAAATALIFLTGAHRHEDE